MSKLDQLISCIQNKHVYIQMHNYPDQDAIASAFGLIQLLKFRQVDSTMIYHGIIDKDNTIKMIELLKIPLHRVEECSFTDKDEIIIVDGQKGNINMRDIAGQEIACIDHHPKQSTDVYRFYDIQSNVGACSSIIAKYFFENGYEPNTEVATALVYGLKIDTAHLSREVSELDLEMFGRLFQLANKAMLRQFEMNSLKISDLASYQQAISHLQVFDNIAIANIGNDCSEAIIGTVNDFLLTITEIEFTLVYSLRAGGIKLSVRNCLEGVDASEVIKEALYGLGDGGGHNDMAAGFIPNVHEEQAAEAIIHRIIPKVIQIVSRTA